MQIKSAYGFLSPNIPLLSYELSTRKWKEALQLAWMVEQNSSGVVWVQLVGYLK